MNTVSAATYITPPSNSDIDQINLVRKTCGSSAFVIHIVPGISTDMQITGLAGASSA
jgi:hypothetical protein